jgi:hypothetical protein
MAADCLADVTLPLVFATVYVGLAHHLKGGLDVMVRQTPFWVILRIISTDGAKVWVRAKNC